MKRTFFYFPLMALFLSACNNGNAVNETPPTAATQESSVSSSSAVSENPLGMGDTAVVPTDMSAPSADQDSKVALNPPHGQPGHRCEIPVGAPLDGSAATNAAPTAAPAPSPAPMFNQPAGQAGQTAPANAKINPPHGQPGHDCAVPVGAPLPG